MKGMFVTGTDTHVGKTWVGSNIIKALRANGFEVTPRKPIETGWDENQIEQSDAWILANAANKLDALEHICPHRFEYPVSPVRAAMLAGKTLTIAEISAQCIEPCPPPSQQVQGFMYIEGAGGFYSPLCSDGLNADLARALSLPILLVVENRLGCINQTLLTVEAIEKQGLDLKAIVLNNVVESKPNDDSMDNQADLKSLLGYPVISILYKQTNKKVFDDIAALF